MSSLGTGYDLSATTFSPDGRVFQVEYAAKAVENSGTVVGIAVQDGVVFGVEKLILSKLYEPSSNRRLFTVDHHIGVAICGLVADGRHLVNRARQEASQYRGFFSSPIPCKILSQRLGSYFQAFTLYSFIRPFGASVLLGSYDDIHGSTLYMAEPSGICWGYHGCAIGKGRQAAKTELEKLDLANMKAVDALKEVARIIYSVHDDAKDKDFELEMSWVTKDTHGQHVAVPKDLVLEAEKKAKQALEEMEED